MKINKLNKYEIEYYIKTHAKIYAVFLLFVCLGVLFGVINAFSSESYIKLLSKEDKVLISFITGDLSSGKLFWKTILMFIVPLIIIFLLNLNYYLGLLSYLIIAYQSALLTQIIFALISTFGISGVFNVIFVIFPINVIYLVIMIGFSVECLNRSKIALKNNYWLYKIKDESFLIRILLFIIAIFVICFIALFILPLFLKSAIFVIF